MVNNLSGLADFLDNDSLPYWLKTELRANQEAIFGALERGEEFTITGPDGQKVKIAPKSVAA
jgi:hypothetical protein